MLQLILRRAVATVPVLLGVSLVSFLLMRLVPGDFTLTLLGPFATERRIAELREFYGLDQPIYVQYFKWLLNVLQGEFGRSIAYRVPVSGLLAERVVNTLILTFAAALVAILFGFLGGTVAAVRRFSFTDRLITLATLVAASAPTFWFGLLLLYVFSLRLGWFPAVGMYTLGREGDLLDLARAAAGDLGIPDLSRGDPAHDALGAARPARPGLRAGGAR
jgi:peptide/nickel transport system permease protein